MSDLTIRFAIEMLLVGVATGIISASLGLGGGIVMVPAFLQFVPGIDVNTAKGSSLFIIIFVSALNSWQEKRRDPHSNWKLAGTLAIWSVVGGYAGGWATSLMPNRVVAAIFVVFLMTTSVRTFLFKPKPKQAHTTQHAYVVGIAIGLATGIVSGATGTGGGAVLVPLVLMYGLVTNERAVALSNTVMIATSAAGALAHFMATKTTTLPWTSGQLCFALAPIVFIGALAGSQLGLRLNRWLTLPRRRVVMGIMLFLVAARLLYEVVAPKA
jgi:uncharacterized membrane protein YfcA